MTRRDFLRQTSAAIVGVAVAPVAVAATKVLVPTTIGTAPMTRVNRVYDRAYVHGDVVRVRLPMRFR